MDNFSIPKKTYAIIPEGTYPAIIQSLEQVEGQFGTQVKFTFSVLDLDEEVNLTGWCSINYSEKSKLFAWTKGALGDGFDPQADFEAAPLIGRRVLINVSQRMSATGTVFNKIEAVMPLPTRQTQKVQPKPVQQKLTDTPTNWTD
jgi:hypothetical protein